jgi:hypothetical protein
VQYAVGFARPDRWRQAARVDTARPWHAVEVIRPPAELDGEVELAVCGAIVQVWGRHEWDRLAAGRTACTECLRLTTAAPPATAPAGDTGVRPVPPRPAGPRASDRHLRAVS